MTEVESDSDDVWSMGSDYGVDYLEPDGILMKEISFWPNKTKTSLVIHPYCPTWITVKGLDTVCSVTCDPVKEDFFQDRIHGFEAAFCYGIRDPDWLPPRPFAQVFLSLNEPCREIQCQEIRGFKDYEVYVLSRHEATPGERKAINYLENKAKRSPLPSHGETIQIAITALKYLLEKDFKADEIKVYVVGKNLWIDKALAVEEIEEHLSGGSPSESSTEEEIPLFERLAVHSDGGPSESSTEEEIPLFEHLALS